MKPTLKIVTLLLLTLASTLSYGKEIDLKKLSIQVVLQDFLIDPMTGKQISVEKQNATKDDVEFLKQNALVKLEVERKAFSFGELWFYLDPIVTKTTAIPLNSRILKAGDDGTLFFDSMNDDLNLVGDKVWVYWEKEVTIRGGYSCYPHALLDERSPQKIIVCNKNSYLPLESKFESYLSHFNTHFDNPLSNGVVENICEVGLDVDLKELGKSNYDTNNRSDGFNRLLLGKEVAIFNRLNNSVKIFEIADFRQVESSDKFQLVDQDGKSILLVAFRFVRVNNLTFTSEVSYLELPGCGFSQHWKQR